MRVFVSIMAVLLTTILISISAYYATRSDGYAVILFFPLVTGVVFSFTVISQLILFLMVHSAKKPVYDFFYWASFTASIILIGFYAVYVRVFGRANDHLSGQISISSDSPFETTEGGSSLSFFGLHLIVLLPIVFQVILMVRRSKQLARQREE